MVTLRKNELESLLQSHWAEFLDARAILDVISQYLINTEIKEIVQDEIPKRHNQLVVSNFKLLDPSKQTNNCFLEITIEFSTTKRNGVVIGTAVFQMGFDGQLNILEPEFRATHLIKRI